MNDFFTPADNADSVLTPEQEEETRAKIQAEIFDGVPAVFDDSAGTDDDPKAAKVVDDVNKEAAQKLLDDDPADPDLDPDPKKLPIEPPPLPPEMQTIVDSLNKVTASLTTMDNRLKQTESRIGGITREFHTAKQVAATQAKAPTPAEMAEAAKGLESWESLKKDFPSWATAIDSKIKTQASSFVSVSDFESLRENVSKIPSVDTQQLEARLVGLIHPDHKEIVADPEYATWLNDQDDTIKHKAYKGTTAEEAIDVFNQYKVHKTANAVSLVPAANVSEVDQIKAKRKEQLKSSTITKTNHKTIKQKSEADMDEAELRAHIASKVFPEG